MVTFLKIFAVSWVGAMLHAPPIIYLGLAVWLIVSRLRAGKVRT